LTQPLGINIHKQLSVNVFTLLNAVLEDEHKFSAVIVTFKAVLFREKETTDDSVFFR